MVPGAGSQSHPAADLDGHGASGAARWRLLAVYPVLSSGQTRSPVTGQYDRVRQKIEADSRQAQ